MSQNILNPWNRRNIIKTGAALGTAAAFASPFNAQAQTALKFVPEAGASLNILRWKRFIQPEEDAFKVVLEKFTKKTGVPVAFTSESLDDVQPKASVAANAGVGPDIIWGLYSLPHLFPDKVVDVTDLADHLGKSHGGWVDSAVKYGKSGDKWIGLTIAFNGNFMNYRKSHINKAGFSEFPKDTKSFLEMMKAMKAQGTPGGFALGHASGDGNSWVHWVLWAHGASVTDANDKVVLNSPETKAALEYAKQMYDNMVSGVGSWNDSSNNKAFLSGEISLTNNGVSILAAAKNDKNPMADDIYHALWPVGPVGKPTELHTAYNMMIMKYTKYPNAAKAFIEFMLSAEAFDPWLEGSVGYLTQSLREFEKNKVWNDPKLTICRDASTRSLTAGYPGSVGEKAAAIIAEFVVLDMFANYCTGRTDVATAISQAERQAKRIYR